MKEAVERTISHCPLCQRIKHPKPEALSMLGQTTSQMQPRLRHWSMDFVRLPTSRQGQYNYLLTIMDYATRWLEAYPVRRATAATVKRILLNDFIPKYGPGCTITSDQDRAFLSDVVRQLIQDNDLKHVTTIAYNPKANPVERIHRELKKKLLMLLESQFN